MLERIIVIPRNGYANRLQAIASAALLAEDLDAEIKIFWDHEQIAMTPANALFGHDFLTKSFLSLDQFLAIADKPHADFPRYMSTDEERGLIVLAGHDRGEQEFMPQLEEELTFKKRLTTMIIIAGGRFHLPQSPRVLYRRRTFYRAISWNAEMNQIVKHLREQRGSYAGFHVRTTDRSKSAPTQRNLRAGLKALTELIPERSLFICADTPNARDMWAREARDIGFDSWHSPAVEFDRTSPDNGVSALVDWRLLSAASGVVFPAASTFSTEAVIAADTGATSVPLKPSKMRTWVRTVRATLFP